MGKIVDVLLKYQTPPFRPPLPDTYEKILINSPILKKQDAYLNGVYEYLTGGYTRGLARDAHALNCPGNVVTCFICGLPLKNIPSFKAEQKRWLAERDKAAKQAGAFGSDAYIDALIKLTSSRNAELKKRIAALPQTDPRCKDYLPVE